MQQECLKEQLALQMCTFMAVTAWQERCRLLKRLVGSLSNVTQFVTLLQLRTGWVACHSTPGVIGA